MSRLITKRTKITVNAESDEQASEAIGYLNEFAQQVPAEKVIALLSKLREKKNPEKTVDKALTFL